MYRLQSRLTINRSDYAVNEDKSAPHVSQSVIRAQKDVGPLIVDRAEIYVDALSK
jgi:hypothetical protein